MRGQGIRSPSRRPRPGPEFPTVPAPTAGGRAPEGTRPSTPVPPPHSRHQAALAAPGHAARVPTAALTLLRCHDRHTAA